MSDEASFVELVAKVRTGDGAAAEEIMQRYGPAVLRTARLRMFNSRLRRVFDSVDIAQSVMKSFLLRIADEGNAWKLDDPSDLSHLLISMTENKVVDKVRRVSAQRRGGKTTTKPWEPGDDPTDGKPGPDEIAMIKEEAQRCWKLLDEEARALYRMRYEAELSWDEIGSLLGSTGEACRKKLERILSDVGRRMKHDAAG